MYKRCIDQQIPPNMALGDISEHGEFFRNLKDEHISKRYDGDDNDNPIYGFKINTKHWKYADRQNGHLSVNLISCIRSKVCSIALHQGGEKYCHVAKIDLKALNEIECFRNSPLCAQYQPDKEIPNHCHFEILPRDGTVLKWMEVGVILDQPFPRAKKLPVSEPDKKIAVQEYAKYQSYFNIHRWVRKKNGTLE